MSDVNIHFYGERGVINGIILDIQNNKAKIDRFFNAIRLLGTDKLPWASAPYKMTVGWLSHPSHSLAILIALLFLSPPVTSMHCSLK